MRLPLNFLAVITLAAVLASCTTPSTVVVPADQPDADLSPPPQPIANLPPGPAAEIKVCVWNIEKLGFANNPPRPARDFAVMATIISDNCDVVGIVEVMAVVGGVNQPGYTSLRAALGNQWSSDINHRALPGNLGQNDEKYAFFWRASRVRQCAGFGVKTYPDNGNKFRRDPAVSCFEALNQVNPGMDFLMAIYHAPSPNANPGPVTEIPGLPGLIGWMRQQRPGEEDLLVVGDFNLRPNQLENAMRNLRKPPNARPFKATELANVFRNSNRGTTINAGGNPTANHYDHFVIVDPTATQEKIGEQIIDGRSAIAATPALNTVQKRNIYYREAVSDHFMAQIRFNVTGPDDD